MSTYLFTSESVCAGHPDKICDQISDAIVDAVIKQDPHGRAAIETMVTKERVLIAGEVKVNTELDYQALARKQIKRLGYTDPKYGFSHLSPVSVFIHQQSSEIAIGVDQKGAGDQGMMFGYACQETPELMPLPITLAHRLAEKIDAVRQSELDYLKPDGKTQVTVQYQDGKPTSIAKMVLAAPHKKSVTIRQVKQDLFQLVVEPVLTQYNLKIEFKDVILNGTGVWHQGGPSADTGITGRKIVVDTYGGMARVGGGCFSGKDPSKVDRSGAYAARFLAKNLVAHGLTEKAEVGLAYCIGHSKPVMFEIEDFETAKANKKELIKFADNILNTSVSGIIEGLNLKRPIYLETAAYGHFGRDSFSWEQVVD